MKKLIVIAIMLGFIALPAYSAVSKATLINASGKKIVVNVGDKIPAGYKLYVKPVEQNIGSAPVNIYNSGTASTTANAAGKAIVVLKANAGRQYAVITNTTATIAYLAFNATTSASQLAGGLADYNFVIPLAASGGTYVINLDNLYIGQIIATSSAACTFRTLEVK